MIRSLNSQGLMLQSSKMPKVFLRIEWFKLPELGSRDLRDQLRENDIVRPISMINAH